MTCPPFLLSPFHTFKHGGLLHFSFCLLFHSTSVILEHIEITKLIYSVRNILKGEMIMEEMIDVLDEKNGDLTGEILIKLLNLD